MYVAIDHGSVLVTPSRPLWRIEKRKDDPSEHVALALHAGADLARRRAQASRSQCGWLCGKDGDRALLVCVCVSQTNALRRIVINVGD